MPLKIADEERFTNISEKEILNRSNGFNNSNLEEPANLLPRIYNKADCEVVLNNSNNAFIVLGRDRYSSLKFGYGSKGHHNCGAIDIVAGRISGFDFTSLTASVVNPSPTADASRVYLSQKADIDDYYNICDGRTGKPVGQAAAIVKSDNVRIVARESFKIIVGDQSKNSAGDIILKNVGVQLIANNDDRDLQPIPKGKNLVDLLKKMILEINELCGLVKGFAEVQQNFNDAFTTHIHTSPFFGIPTSPPLGDAFRTGLETSLEMMSKVEAGANAYSHNLNKLGTDYLVKSPTYICSEYHFLN